MSSRTSTTQQPSYNSPVLNQSHGEDSETNEYLSVVRVMPTPRGTRQLPQPAPNQSSAQSNDVVLDAHELLNSKDVYVYRPVNDKGRYDGYSESPPAYSWTE